MRIVTCWPPTIRLPLLRALDWLSRMKLIWMSAKNNNLPGLFLSHLAGMSVFH